MKLRISLYRIIAVVSLILTGIGTAGPDLRGYEGMWGNGQAYPFDVQESSVNWGDIVTIRFAVANFGDSQAAASKVGIFISGDTSIGDGDDYRIKTYNLGTINPSSGGYVDYGANGQCLLPSINPLPGSPTTVYVGMVVDVDGDVAEDNEGNNSNLGNGIDRDDTPVTITPGLPDIHATDSTSPGNDHTVAFGNVANDGENNARGVETITLLNAGKASLTVSNITLSGNSDFSIVEIASSVQNFINLSTLPRVVAQNGAESWVFTLEFDPTTTAGASGTLTIETNDPDTPSLAISLTGTGVAVPDIGLTASEAEETDFGSVVQDGGGGFQATETITLKNAGTGPLTVSQNGISMLTGTHYSLVSVTSSAQGTIDLSSGPATVAADETEIWTIVVLFDPTALGQHQDGVQIVSDDPDETTFTASVTGKGVAAMALQVTDSSGTPDDEAIALPDTHADGAGQESETAIVTLRNTGGAGLTVAQNGLALASGAHFGIDSVVSDTVGMIDLASGPAQIAADTGEMWTVTVVFDPTTSGALSDTLSISSDDPASPVVDVSVSGTGLDQAALSVADSVAPSDDLNVDFGALLNDGAGRRTTHQTLTLKDVGSQPIIVAQNGIAVSGGGVFSVESVVSSTRGPVDVSSPSDAERTIAAAQTEIWTVTLAFDPQSDGSDTSTVSIASNDSLQPLAQVAVSGTGATPDITLNTPDTVLNVSVGSVFKLAWQDEYAAGNAVIALYLDDDTNAASGLIAITDGISENDTEDAYDWRVNPTLVGSNCYVYATISDGTVTNGDYAAGSLHIDPSGAFTLRSPTEVTNPDYGYEYEYDGQIYTGVRHLQSGYNTLTVSSDLPDGGTATFQFGVTVVPSLIHTERTSHDELNRVVEFKNGNGINTTYTYSQMGRLVRRASDNGAVVEFAYDVLGRRTSMTDYTGTTFYEWDNLDRLTAVTMSENPTKGDGDDLTVQYEYDLAGRKTAIIYPYDNERIEYTYDDAGRMLTVTNISHDLGFQYTYNPTNGLLTSLSRPNGIDTHYAYDGMGRLTNILHQKTSGELVVNFGYTLDDAGKATEFRTTETGGVERVEQYTYDRFDRLTGVVYSADGVIEVNDKTVTYTYDGNGNRLSMTTKVDNEVSEVRLYEYGNENRLLRVTDDTGVTVTEYRYDAAGNTIQETSADCTRFFSYDERNLLTSFTDGSNHVIYAYNGDGQRVIKTVNGETTTFVNDINRPIWETVQEIGSEGRADASATFGARRLTTYESAVTFEFNDRLGSVRHAANMAGVVTDSSTYEAFGAVTVRAGSRPRNGYSGESRDRETGLTFLRARYYDPVTGRFMSRDPLGIAPGLNTYSYVGNSPINYVDPLGLDDSDYWASVLAEAGVNTLSDLATGNIGGDTYYGGFIPGSGRDFANVVDANVYGQGALLDSAGTASQLGLSAHDPQTPAMIHDLAVNYAVQHGGAEHFFDLKNPAIQQAHWQLAKTTPYPLVSNGFTAMVGAGKVLNAIENVGDAIGDFFSSADGNTSGFGFDGGSVGDLTSFTRQTYAPPPPPPPGGDVGGVLIDKAAQLVGTNLSDLRGAVYFPMSGQFVFLGTDDGGAEVKDINLDYLWTALKAVYGSAAPPFVTLDPPASAYTQWSDFGDGDGVFEVDEKGGFFVRYNPLWSEEDTTVDITIRAEWSGSDYTWTARFDCLPENIYSGDRRMMKMVFDEWTQPPPAGITLDTTPWQWHIFSQSAFTLGADGQDSFTRFTLHNGTAGNFLVNSIRVLPARQHREFGGRVENTRLGWVMLEADRVMKCLGVGRDNLLTNITYNSTTVDVAGYQNMTERGSSGGNIRMWFTPNEMTLKRHLDPETGRASVVFDQASVALNTESKMMGLPQPLEARDFADHFTANYDDFATIDFPCVDPDDPDGTNIVQVKIFDMLKDAMQAVSLARFFRDNDVPVDMWWMNSWQPEVAYSPRSCATAFNKENGMIIYGGVEVNKPNSYVPSATAQSVADTVQSSRPDIPSAASDDIDEQVWDASTVEGDLKAVAAQTDAEPQDGNIRLAEVDLSFASPGAPSLQFMRSYQSAWLGRYQMGPGWRYVPFTLEFERPSWFDEHSLMTDTDGAALWTDGDKDTRLRSGAIRVVDLRTGAALDFSSSLVLGYAIDNIGNAVITVSGLNTNALPSFAPGVRKSGATLVQLEDERKYELISPDGSKLTFDYDGGLLEASDRNGNRQTYTWDEEKGILLSIEDDAGQALDLVYNAESNRVVSVSGPAGEQVTYTYTTNGCLERATHVRSTGYVQYAYNADNQLIGKRLYNGLNILTAEPDLRGRPNVTADLRSNTLERAFSLDDDAEVRTTETTDPLVTDPQFVPWQRRIDREGRILASRDATGTETLFGYDTGSMLPNTIDLPIAGRPAIGIERNEFGQPTRISDPGNTGAQDVTAAYDAVTKLLSQMSDQAGRNTEIAYDAENNVTRVRRQIGDQNVDIRYSYTPSGALHTMTNALDITTITIHRDTVDRATNVVDATGVSIRYEYDSLGRLLKVHDPRLIGPVEYVYDSFDRVVEIKYPVGSVFFEYDPSMGWLVRQTDILGRATRYVRDPDTGDILQIVDEAESPAGPMIASTGNEDRITEMTYNRFGQLESVTPPDSSAITFSFDDLGRLLGSSETDDTPPGTPVNLDSDAATDGVWTTARDHAFTWGAPMSDSGIGGYSWALDALPDTNINTAGASVAVNDVEHGQHVFRVKAKGNNGLWGSSAEFNLWVNTNKYTVMATAGEGGSINPPGALIANFGTRLPYSISATNGYRIADLSINGVPARTFDEGDFSYAYTTPPVSNDLTILASFVTNGVVVTHSTPGYHSPGTNIITCMVSYPEGREPLSFLLRPHITNGWPLAWAWGDGVPVTNATAIVLSGDLTNNPIVFNYALKTPAGVSGPQEIRATAEFLLDGMINPATITAMPDPLVMTQRHYFAVSSEHGGSEPSTGIHSFTTGSLLNCAVTNSPIEVGTLQTQYVAKGWALSGCVSTAGLSSNAGTNVSLTLTNSAHLEWNWAMNYWIDTDVVGNGSVNLGDTPCEQGSSVVITGTPAPYHSFYSWSGDTEGCTINGNQIVVPMTKPRRIVANFRQDMADIGVSKTIDTATPGEGDSVQYTLTVTNTGPHGASGLVVADVLPAGVTFSASSDSGNYASVTGLWTIDDLPPSCGTNMTITAAIDHGTGGTTITNTATVVGLNQTDGASDNDSDSAVLTVRMPPVSIAVTTEGIGTVTPRDSVSVPHGSHTNFLVVAGEGHHIESIISNGNHVTGSPYPDENTTSLNYTWENATADGAFHAIFAPDSLRLTVESLHGIAVPGAGVHTNHYGQSLTNMVNSPITYDSTQYVSRGWAMSGNAPMSGLTNSMTMVQTNDAVLTWLWLTNFSLDVATEGAGSTDVEDMWCASGSEVTVTATPGSGHVFREWSGNTNGCIISNTTVTVPMTQARSITAHFEAITFTVTNVVAAQRPGTKLVEITYDLSCAHTNQAAVFLSISNGTIPVSSSQVTGDIGPGISTGTQNVIVWDAGADWGTSVGNLDFHLQAGIGSPPAKMVLVPGGINTGATPFPYSLTNETFFLDRNEVTKQLWSEVRSWGAANGYSIGAGRSKAANHPVDQITWYDCAKWCNARSEMEGLPPCYTVDGAVYRTGNSAPVWNLFAGGYRLPTTDEWQYAARGGLTGKRFPWGDYITHSNANYYSTSSHWWDLSPTPGHHPDYFDGVYPYTSPVGSFAPNGYGLFDMGGNINEWCWNGSSTHRYVHDGSWANSSHHLMLWTTVTGNADHPYSGYGLRAVRDLPDVGGPGIGAGSTTASIDTRNYALHVVSPHGTPVPNAGTHSNYCWRSSVTCSVDGAVTNAGTRHVCKGWNLTNSEPSAGSATNTGPITLTNVTTTVVWLWEEHLWLDTESIGNGTVSPADQWCQYGTTMIVTGMPGTNHHLSVWGGDTNGCATSDNEITVPMTEPRQISATFAQNTASVSITKQVSNGTPGVGEMVYYSLSVTNEGPHLATGLVVTDVLPASVTLIAVSDTGAYAPDSGLWTIGDLAANASTGLTITATVDPGTGGRAITNSAAITSMDQADTSLSDNIDTAIISEVQAADISLEKTVTDGSPSAGGSLVYRIAVSNAGPTVANNVVVTDLLPMGVTTSQELTNSIGSLSVGQVTSYLFTVSIDADTLGWITNTAMAVSGTPDPDLDNNNDTAVSAVVAASHACQGYRSPGTNSIYCEFQYDASQVLTSLQWRTTLPTGWSMVSVTGEGSPRIDGTAIIFDGPFTTNRLTMSCVINVPAEQVRTNTIRGNALFRLAGMPEAAEVVATPGPLTIRRFHHADYQPPFFIIDATELNRVLAYWRSQLYHIEPLGHDGYAAGAGNTNGIRHDADYRDPAWQFGLAEAQDIVVVWLIGGAYTVATNGFYAPDWEANAARSASIDAVDETETGILIEGPTWYNPGDLVEITNILTFANALISLSSAPQLPSGWILESVTADGFPEDERNGILWTREQPQSPVHMVYTVRTPVTELRRCEIRTQARYYSRGMTTAETVESPHGSVVVSPRDTDGDGMPDGWEAHYSGSTTQLMATADSDGDGMVNPDECIAGTDPLDAKSVFALAAWPAATNHTVVLQWPSAPDRTYDIWVWTQLTERPSLLATDIPATPPMNRYEDTMRRKGVRFYQITTHRPE